MSNRHHILRELATRSNFDEEAYLTENPDVDEAVKGGIFKTGRHHFEAFGEKEGRMLCRNIPVNSAIKKYKLQKIIPLLRHDMPYIETEYFYDFLSQDLQAQFDIIETDAVSSHGYDGYAMQLLEKHADGIILDCGAGKRPVYFENVVNFEIASYDTTDVRGVGEKLPFIDKSFDAVISLQVLEHVKDTFICAKEISRVLKPGGDLICAVPFLQPFHAYPHHYYNMTQEGLKNLFKDFLAIDDVKVYGSLLPIGTLSWIVRSWANGLTGKAKEEFLNLKISELLEDSPKYYDRSFVKELSEDKNRELACGNVLFAHKEI